MPDAPSGSNRNKPPPLTKLREWHKIEMNPKNAEYVLWTSSISLEIEINDGLL
jgi:hypothetical protein